MHTEDVELWGAVRIISMHAAGDGCARCEPDGTCRLHRWADVRLKTWEAERGTRYDSQAPGWSAAAPPRSRDARPSEP